MVDSTPKRLLFVCTGNTCRSPMAERLMAHVCRGIPGWTFASAGIFASNGSPASAQAVTALKEKGVDLSSHRSRRLTLSLAQEADLLVPMTREHHDLILQTGPGLESKTHTLHSFGLKNPQGDVLDPVGGCLETYRLTRDEIESALTDLILALMGPPPPPSTSSPYPQENS